MGLRFTEEPTTAVYEIEKMTWDEMEEVFYTDEEIGEFRYSAFMINSGLEEEDWSTPDVEPVPWPKEVDEMKIKNFATNRTELKENQLKAKRQSQLFDLATKGDSKSVTTCGLEEKDRSTPDEAPVPQPKEVDEMKIKNFATNRTESKENQLKAKQQSQLFDIATKDDSTSVTTSSSTTEPATPGSGGKPRLRPQTLVSPRRSRNSKAHLYSLNLIKPMLSVDADTLAISPLPEEFDSEDAIANGDSTTSNPVDDAESKPKNEKISEPKQGVRSHSADSTASTIDSFEVTPPSSPSNKKPSLKLADSVPLNGAKTKKKSPSAKRPASLRVLIERIGASVSPASRSRRGAKIQESLRLMSNNDSSMSEVTADLPEDEKPSNKSKSNMYGITSELTADPHEDENDDKQPQSANSLTKKSIIGTTKTQTRWFSRSQSSGSQSMLSSITNKFKTGSKIKSDGQKNLHQKEVPPSSNPSGIVFSDLPTEVKQRVALLLPIGDVMNLVAATKSMRSDLNLDVVSSPLTDRDSQNKVCCTGIGSKCIAALVPNPLSSLHTMRFTCGVRVGLRPFCKVWIVEQNLPVDQAPENLERLVFYAGKVIAKTPSLDRDSESLALTFRVKPGKIYQLYARSRSHLHLDNMTLQRVCFNAKTLDYTAYQFDAMLKP